MLLEPQPGSREASADPAPDQLRGLRSPQCSDRSALIVFGMATRSMRFIFG
jgi:hypothetical protein